MSTPTLSRDVSAPLSTNPHLLRWVGRWRDLTRPESIHWVDGSAGGIRPALRSDGRNGTLTRLNEDLWPGCYYARSDPNDVARVESRTFVCSLSKDSRRPDQQLGQPVRDARAS